MAQLPLSLSEAPQPRRRGRPPGAKNRRSVDLSRYIEATYGGMTPGQQAAELAMVKPADLKKAKDLARDLGILDHGLSPMMLAMAVKARQLAAAIGCETKEAWLLLQKERADLMPYIHQRQAPKADDGKVKAPATVFLVPDGEGHDQAQLADFSADPDDIEIIDDLPAHPAQVGQMKSDDDT
jgi:hypothetical protein